MQGQWFVSILPVHSPELSFCFFTYSTASPKLSFAGALGEEMNAWARSELLAGVEGAVKHGSSQTAMSNIAGTVKAEILEPRGVLLCPWQENKH